MRSRHTLLPSEIYGDIVGSSHIAYLFDAIDAIVREYSEARARAEVAAAILLQQLSSFALVKVLNRLLSMM